MELATSCLLTVIVLVSCSIGYSGAADCTGNGGSPTDIAETVVVDKGGRGHFSTIQAAINSVPSGNSQWIRILINPGTYKYNSSTSNN